MLRTTTILLLLCVAQSALAATLRVPEDHKTIQAAIDAAQPRDTIIVSPGKYPERKRVKPRITLRSLGEDIKDSTKPAHVFGNTAISKDDKAKVVEIQGPAGVVAENVVQSDRAKWR